MSAAAQGADVAERVAAVRERIRAACERAGRDPSAVTLIAVSKTHPAEAVVEAMAAGITDFGENRVQEALQKQQDVQRLLETGPAQPDPGPNWHLVGHLQTNKARVVAGRFAILHAVDSERLLRAVAAAAEYPVQVMIEVNVAAEPTKFGVAPDGLPALLELAKSLPIIDVQGLMTVAPQAPVAETVRPVFRRLRELTQEHGLHALSMGMTEDFEVAIEEGATHIRIGRAIFGERLQ